MKLCDVVEKQISVHLVCKVCGAHQPAYPQALVDRHGPDTELDVALKRAPCIFCDEAEQFTAMVISVS